MSILTLGSKKEKKENLQSKRKQIEKKGTRFIKDVLLVPNLKENLLSIGQMMEKGYSFHFEGDMCTIYDKKNKRQEIAKVKLENGNISFPISFEYTTNTNIAMRATIDDSWL